MSGLANWRLSAKNWFISIGDKLFRYGDFFSEKIIVGPQEAQDPRFWLPWTMTHYILGSICFRTPPTPPIWLETQKCAILSTFWESGGKNHPKVEARREKFNIGNFPHIFLWPYIYVGTMWFHFRNIFQWKSFHRHRQRHRHRSPVHFLKFG